MAIPRASVQGTSTANTICTPILPVSHESSGTQTISSSTHYIATTTHHPSADDVAISRILMLNVQSINPSARSRCRWKILYLRKQLAGKKDIPFIALTETWLKPYVTDAMVDIDRYNVFRCDRSTRVGGGVMLYCQENLPITNVHILMTKFAKLCFVQCTCAISKSVFCIVYRPPDCTEQSFKLCLSFIYNYLDSVSDEFELNILGDFNFPRVIWSSYTILPGGSDAEKKCCKLFFDFMSDHLCRQLITEPTR